MNVLFDLDGTLTDSSPGITKCIQYALTELGYPAPPVESLRWCLGPPLKQSFATLLAPDSQLADVALEKYRERFSTVGLFENSVYPGIEEALNDLSRRGHSLYVATSKPRVYAERIIEHFGLTKYFRSVDGSELDGTRTDKAELIAYILKRESIAATGAVMIGDREHDMIGAVKNQVRGIGVLWGYGSREELEKAGADACIASPKELPNRINPG
jgi:phosphoglycolate phosphatase